MSADKKSLLTEDPRVPLAAERTFLAWIRTGLVVLGVVLNVAALVRYSEPTLVAVL